MAPTSLYCRPAFEIKTYWFLLILPIPNQTPPHVSSLIAPAVVKEAEPPERAAFALLEGAAP
jgi:hypothetical protein